MECLDGKTLKHCVAGKPLKTDELLDLSIQTVDALATKSDGKTGWGIAPPWSLYYTRGESLSLSAQPLIGTN